MDRSVLPIEIDRSWPGSSTLNSTTFFRTDCVIEKHGVEYDSKDIFCQPVPHLGAHNSTHGTGRASLTE
jgi:hypothetical protein